MVWVLWAAVWDLLWSTFLRVDWVVVVVAVFVFNCKHKIRSFFLIQALFISFTSSIYVLLLHVNSVQFPFYKKSGITVLTCEVKRTVVDLLCYYDVCLYNSQYQTKYFTDV